MLRVLCFAAVILTEVSVSVSAQTLDMECVESLVMPRHTLMSRTARRAGTIRVSFAPDAGGQAVNMTIEPNDDILLGTIVQACCVAAFRETASVGAWE